MAIEKVCHFPGIHPETGETLFQVIQPGESGGLLKTAQALHPKVRAFVSKLKPDKGTIYPLLTALGAGEYYSSNINGDHFPQASLLHEGDDFGHRTFLRAHVFRHHQNKDPKASFGSIPLSVWNDDMKRVELILAVERLLAKKHGAQDVVDKLDAGVPLSVSMGCRVAYDVCSICGNKAPTRAQYCTHLLNDMNQIYPDGRKVCAVNPQPRFFDLSFVFIGADKIAKTMCKIASGGCCPTCETLARDQQKLAMRMHSRTRIQVPGLTKVASVPKVAVKKLSDIFKNTPSTFVGKTIPSLEDSEPDIPRPLLDHMGSQYPLNEALATPSMMGIILRPREYQRIILIRIGLKPLADGLDRRGEVFKPSDKVDTSIPISGFRESLFNKLVPMLGRRSGFGPILQQRMMRLLVSQPKVASDKKYSSKGFLSSLSAGYNGYRLGVLSEVPHSLPGVLDQHPKLAEALFRDHFLDTLSKKAEADTSTTPLKSLLGIFPVLYLLSAHWNEQELHGERLGYIEKYIAEHPGLSSFLLAGALTKLRGAAA